MSEEAKASSSRAKGARRRGQGKSLDLLAAWGLWPLWGLWGLRQKGNCKVCVQGRPRQPEEGLNRGGRQERLSLVYA